jgi:glucokinase
VEWACDALAVAVADVIHILQPEVVVIAGGMAAAGDALLRRVRDGVARRVRPAWLAPVRVVAAALGDDAGWIGAALWGARQAACPEGTAAHLEATES